jgi:hypothetical protein
MNDGLEASSSLVGHAGRVSLKSEKEPGRVRVLFTPLGDFGILISYIRRLRKYHGGETDFWRDRVIDLPRIL